MDIILTVIVGGTLLACGFILGRQGTDTFIKIAIQTFIIEMVQAKLINEKKLNAYIIKKYGKELGITVK